MSTSSDKRFVRLGARLGPRAATLPYRAAWLCRYNSTRRRVIRSPQVAIGVHYPIRRRPTNPGTARSVALLPAVPARDKHYNQMDGRSFVC